jgi:hypothetical protein
LAFKDRRERAAHCQHAVEVRFHLRARRRLVDAAGNNRCAAHDAGVVDDDGDVRIGLGCGGDVVGIRHVELDRLDTRQIDCCRVSRGRINLLRTRVEQRLDVGATESAIGARDERDRTFDVHGFLLW